MKTNRVKSTLSRRSIRELVRTKADAEALGAPPLPATWNYRFQVARTSIGDKVLLAEIWEKSPSVPLLRRRIARASMYGREIELMYDGNLKKALRSVAQEAYRARAKYEPFTYSVVRQRLACL